MYFMVINVSPIVTCHFVPVTRFLNWVTDNLSLICRYSLNIWEICILFYTHTHTKWLFANMILLHVLLFYFILHFISW